MDLKEALFKAKNGDADALYFLGRTYYLGELETQNIPKALDYLEQAAELNHDLALWSLGVFHHAGGHKASEPEKAFSYFAKAADLGNVSSALQAGLILSNLLENPNLELDHELAVQKIIS